MATVQNSVQDSTVRSFQEVYSTCYSHGLESIYKLENVDLKSIRKLAAPLESVTERSSLSLLQEWHEDQLTFDLGNFYRGWMIPYTLDGPIQVLQLAKPIERKLLEGGCSTVRVLQTTDLQSLRIGQGHIEEIRHKLKIYLAHKPVEKTDRIDFLALIQCLLGSKSLWKAYLTLEPFSLHQWIALTPSESMEIKRLTSEQRNAGIEEIKRELAREIPAYFSVIIETWVKPWMARRGGVATREELNEYLILQSSEEKVAQEALHFLNDLVDIYATLPLSGDVYAFSLEMKKNYRFVLDIAKTYFKSNRAKFVLDDLVLLIASELATRWASFSLEQIKKILQLSFPLSRDSKGIWMVGAQTRGFYGASTT